MQRRGTDSRRTIRCMHLLEESISRTRLWPYFLIGEVAVRLECGLRVNELSLRHVTILPFPYSTCLYMSYV